MKRPIKGKLSLMLIIGLAMRCSFAQELNPFRFSESIINTQSKGFREISQTDLLRNKFNHPVQKLPVTNQSAYSFVPRFERHRGAIFCRMEDAVEQRTKLFKLTIGLK
jgi:hypothetical protein